MISNNSMCIHTMQYYSYLIHFDISTNLDFTIKSWEVWGFTRRKPCNWQIFEQTNMFSSKWNKNQSLKNYHSWSISRNKHFSNTSRESFRGPCRKPVSVAVQSKNVVIMEGHETSTFKIIWHPPTDYEEDGDLLSVNKCDSRQGNGIEQVFDWFSRRKEFVM